jgi:hypothetical protein
MPLIATRGAASAQGFGEFAQTTAPVYIEDVFSTYLYTGNGSTQTITNGIDLSGKGGMLWTKQRNSTGNNSVFDSVRGIDKKLITNATLGQTTDAYYSSWNSNGFTLNTSSAEVNGSGSTYVSWTFREQPKFFDVVTYTGNGSNRTISHNLGSVPGCIIVKRTNTTGNWQVYHRGLTSAANVIQLNDTAAQVSAPTVWNSTDPTSTVFSVGTGSNVNANGSTYVAYLFAHNAGGFGLSGTDNVISCGSYTGNGSATGPTITLNYEPQWLLIKKSSAGSENWMLVDNMRGFVVGGNDARLFANTDSAEASATRVSPTSTGFQINSTDDQVNTNGDTYIYIAIRRGPMKVPTSATTVFKPITYVGNGSTNSITGMGFPPDLLFGTPRNFNYSYFVNN